MRLAQFCVINLKRHVLRLLYCVADLAAGQAACQGGRKEAHITCGTARLRMFRAVCCISLLLYSSASIHTHTASLT